MPLMVLISAAGNQISDITPLKDLMYLEIAWLDGNPIKDASPLWGPLKRYEHFSYTVDVEIGEPPTEEEAKVEDEEDTGEGEEPPTITVALEGISGKP